MDMRINPNSPATIGPAAERVTDAGRTASSGRKDETARAGDSAQVSFDQEKLQQLKVELSRVPEIRQERVDALRRTLLEGNYRIDEHRVAEAVWADLLAPARPGE